MSGAALSGMSCLSVPCRSDMLLLQLLLLKLFARRRWSKQPAAGVLVNGSNECQLENEYEAEMAQNKNIYIFFFGVCVYMFTNFYVLICLQMVQLATESYVYKLSASLVRSNSDWFL